MEPGRAGRRRADGQSLGVSSGFALAAPSLQANTQLDVVLALTLSDGHALLLNRRLQVNHVP
ncbi:MAG: hypothetical protein LRY38_10860 [Aeromonadaceae bacterium]|nr:hypothetical protein [Aeromonadaceae bacterium]